ncbi:hypothetical protein F5J12DRAFT_44508 [Pisolithus orientalis]|uniref:uncharacterized protein n=1 Tax=Pisolithus orientalis TaxID=936130 RepID=UPI00222477F1|nr:uncharacterized protein F5J12DRAFT_44508 [Pisolithus orientalis]KAI6009622.1 hypothetical protein F5J12DRAFT_44508 [Pisolithus orientalis]
MLSNDGYGTPCSSPVKTRKLDRMPEITGIDDDEDDDNDDYYSLDDDSVSDVSEASDVDATQTFVDQEKQEMERRRVLEAAGVIVSNLKDHNRSMSHPRHANRHGVGVDGATGLGGSEGERGFSIGAAFQRKRHESLPPAHEPLSCARHKELPPVPMMEFSEDPDATSRTGINARLSPMCEILSTSVQPTHLKTTSDSSSTSRVDDAFERYETYKKLHGGQSLATNRLSASSFDTASSLRIFITSSFTCSVSVAFAARSRTRTRWRESYVLFAEFSWTSHAFYYAGHRSRAQDSNYIWPHSHLGI